MLYLGSLKKNLKKAEYENGELMLLQNVKKYGGRETVKNAFKNEIFPFSIKKQVLRCRWRWY